MSHSKVNAIVRFAVDVDNDGIFFNLHRDFAVYNLCCSDIFAIHAAAIQQHLHVHFLVCM